ncbi:gamma-glutamyltransferase [Spirulina major]|uniref:gamma-glutamyltransferase n=1 Tax=Spirulina major TaxID=270636 RepID=UPI000A071839|nr:gamma-glutamyltransferase [Spirulina major]
MMMGNKTVRWGVIGVVVALWVALSGGPMRSQSFTPIFDYSDRTHPVLAEQGMVATQEALATEAGLAVLKQGGNAIDAAVTVGFVLAVTLPRAGNLGGGGFMVLHQAAMDETVAIDYRETAPQAATRDMFLDADGNADPQKSRFSHLAVGVPGTVAGLAQALETYGTIALADALQPAIALATDGFPVSQDLYESLWQGRDRLTANPATRAIFYHDDGTPYRVGEILKQPDLARSLQQIADQGIGAFYQGEIAEAIASEMANNGGLITQADLAAYRPALREPVQGNYHGYQVYSMPPPSSGGVHLIQLLNILEPFPLDRWGHNSAKTIHLMAEAMKRAYSDRAQYLGDPDFVDVPVAGLTSRAYAAELRAQINRDRATPSNTIKPGNPIPPESDETTHYAIVDRFGNAVANTYTLNFSYGSGITVPGTGILLNNEMDDFSAKPGVPNAYGLIGGEANAIAPGKRMLSSMSPTLVMRDGKPVLITGSPGGSRIITIVLQMILNVIDHGMNIAEASAAPRIHHQWLPDQLYVEEGISPDTIALLRLMGHDVQPQYAAGSVQSILIEGDRITGASDPRKPDALTLGY